MAGPESGFFVSVAADRAERLHGERIDRAGPQGHIGPG